MIPIPESLGHPPLDSDTATLEPEGLTVERSLLLDLYTAFHRRNYASFRLEFPNAAGEPAIAHVLIPPPPGPHPAVVVFPILGGSHLVSEAIAKALVRRGFAVLRLERQPLALRKRREPGEVVERMARGVRDARRLLDWAETRAELRADRVGVLGVSFGSLLAALLHAADSRVAASALLLCGGGLAELVHDSSEREVRSFRKRLMADRSLSSRSEFIAELAPLLAPVDPLRYAERIDPREVLLVSARLDRVIPAARTRALWSALGEPDWLRLPTGHTQSLPFLWYVASRAARHFDALLRADPR